MIPPRPAVLTSILLAVVLAGARGGAVASQGRGTGGATQDQAALRRAADRWVAQTLKAMTLDTKIGQMLAPAINAAFTPVDSDLFERTIRLARDLHVGAIHVFGTTEPMPAALLNPTYGAGGSASRKGDPYAAAALLDRLQRESAIPLLVTADFEGGVGYILNGGTRFPRAMAIGASRDPALAFRAGQATAAEGRGLGVLVDFYPVVDVNNNPRNPIINIRSFGEDVGLVSGMAVSYIKGIQAGGMLATAKHFPGHGDTATDTHLGLARIDHPRARLDQVELAPFRAAVTAGVDVVMSSHIILPALDPSGLPATLSRPMLTGVLRGEMGFEGLIVTDSMAMWAISRQWPPDRAAAMAVEAGVDLVLDTPDPDAAFRGIKAAVASGEISEAQVTRSVERILEVKAHLGLNRERTVDLASLDRRLGGRANAKLASEICERGLTLIKDERNQVPLVLPRDAQVLYLSVVDYPSGWREGAPSRSFIPALKARWPNVTAVEISDRTTPAEFDLVRALARRADAIVASVFVRVASDSGRMDLTPEAAGLLGTVADTGRPFVTVVFGNPYVVAAMPKAPAVLLTYEEFDAMEVAAVRAIAGEVPIGGKLPITLPGLFPYGHGLDRAARATSGR